MVFGESLDLELSARLLHCCATVAPSGGAFRVSGRALENSHAPRSLVVKPAEYVFGIVQPADRLHTVRSRRIKRACGIKHRSTRHATQGRPAGMERSAKKGCAIHRASAASKGARMGQRGQIRGTSPERFATSTLAHGSRRSVTPRRQRVYSVRQLLQMRDFTELPRLRQKGIDNYI